jgi:hypothetical protein
VKTQRPPAVVRGHEKSDNDSNNVSKPDKYSDGGSKWEPGRSWRRQGSEKGFLSSLERRYLRDVLLALERSNKPFTSGFVVKPQGKRALTEVGLPRPLAKLVANGLINTVTADQQMNCFLTKRGLDGIRRWMAAKPPDFRLMFPNLYVELAETVRANGPVRKASIRKRRPAREPLSLSDNMKS